MFKRDFDYDHVPCIDLNWPSTNTFHFFVLHVNFIFSKLQIQQSTYEVSYHCKIHEVSLFASFYVHSTSKNASLDATVSEYTENMLCSTGLWPFVCVSKNIFCPFYGVCILCILVSTEPTKLF